MRHLITKIAALVVPLIMALPAGAFEARATSAFVIDQTTGTVLLNKNADQMLPACIDVQTDDPLHHVRGLTRRTFGAG